MLTPSGIGQAIAAETARRVACEPSACKVTTRSPSLRGDQRADLDDRARRDVADDVRHHLQRAHRARQQVTAFDADRFHVDHEAVVRAHRVGQFAVREHFGSAIDLDRCCKHRKAFQGKSA
ncbi:MAG: hypothetical protein V4569_14415 [Pseudomonadota bacterium]